MAKSNTSDHFYW